MVAKKAKKSSAKECTWDCDWSCSKSGGSCLWFLGFLGAAIYYIQMADGFWMGVWGVIKALVWPALLVYQFLGMG